MGKYISLYFFCIRTKDRILEEVSKYNFYSNGCAYKFADNKLFLFNLDNKFRKFIIRIITNRIFDLIILLFIFANSIFIGLSDYDCLDVVTKVYMDDLLLYFYIVSISHRI